MLGNVRQKTQIDRFLDSVIHIWKFDLWKKSFSRFASQVINFTVETIINYQE